MNDDIPLPFVEGEPPDAASVERMGSQLAASLKPIRPLPSNAALCMIALGVFLVSSLIVATAVGLKAPTVLSASQMMLYYGVLLVFAGLFSRAVIERMVPGSKHRIRSAALSVIAIATLGLLALILFSNHGTERFVQQGIPCLRLGVVGAFLSGLLGWRLLKRGYLVSPRETIALYGLFAGLAGVAVLALHCPILNSLHVLVWHLGAMLLAGFAGLLLGSYAD
jgi:hypothetical protein